MRAIAPAKQKQYCHRALFLNQEMRATVVLFLARVKLHSFMPSVLNAQVKKCYMNADALILHFSAANIK